MSAARTWREGYALARVLWPAQILAAQMAGLGRLVIHTGDPHGEVPLGTARCPLRDELMTPAASGSAQLLEAINGLGFEWGESDGN